MLVWLQFSSFFFFCAGHFSDLLVIRICLVLAYIFLFITSIQIDQIDGIGWSIVNLYVHITTVYRLLRDEKSVPLGNVVGSNEKGVKQTPSFNSNSHENNNDDGLEALWRMFYRTGGLSRLLFQHHIAQYCKVVTYEHEDTINTQDFFYIIYKGTVQLTVTDDNGAIVSSRRAQSGQLFDFRALGLLEDYISLQNHKLQAVVAVSNVTLFQFPRNKMSEIAANNPTTRLMWKEILMENLLRIVQRYIDSKVRIGPDYINPIFAPLAPWEEPEALRAGSGKALQTPFQHVYSSAVSSFAPPWPFQGPPVGLRHSQLVAPGRVQNVPPKRLLDAAESKSFDLEGGGAACSENTSLSMNHPSPSYQSTLVEEEEEMLDTILDVSIDEEMLGGLDMVKFKRAVSCSSNAEADADKENKGNQ